MLGGLEFVKRGRARASRDSAAPGTGLALTVK